MNGPAGLAGMHDHRCREYFGGKRHGQAWPANLLFATYVIAATLMILKAVGMMQAKGGFRSPEDLKETSLNPKPNPVQLALNERVERVWRIQMNDLDNLPFFLVAGFVYILTQSPCYSHSGCSTPTWCPACSTSPPTSPDRSSTYAPPAGPWVPSSSSS